MKLRVSIVLVAIFMFLLPGFALAVNVGYYEMCDGQGDPNQVPGIILAGDTPVNMTDLAAADLVGIDVLNVLNCSNGGYGGEYISRLADIQAAVSAGMVLIIHDRFVANAENILPGGAGFNIIRDFGDAADIDILDNTTLVTNGPGGVINNTSLDGGNSSSHGYAVAASLPGNAILLLSRSDPSRIVTFAYPFGSGWVIYSTIPMDYYLAGSGPINTRINMQNYFSNVTAYAASGLAPPLFLTNPASGFEDTLIDLEIGLNQDFPDLQDITIESIVISGVPAGAWLSAGFNMGGGQWGMLEEELDGLQIFPPENSNVDILLTITSEYRVDQGNLQEDVNTLMVDLIGVADDPIFGTGNSYPFGLQYNLPVNIDAELTDNDSSETLTITISNVPNDAFLSAGTNLGGGVWSLNLAHLNGLRIALPHRLRYYIKWDLGVMATVTENDGDTNVLVDTIKVIYIEESQDVHGNYTYTVKSDGGGGGCSIGNGSGRGIVLPLMLLGSIGFLLRRRKN